MKFRGPLYIQGCAWSAILDKRSVVGLAPAGGGKTLAYVAPIVAMLLSNNRQMSKDGLTKVQAMYLQAHSPSVVVLCSTGRSVKVCDIYCVSMSLSDKATSLFIYFAYVLAIVQARTEI